MGTLKVNVALIALFGCLDITFLLLMAGEFTGSVATHKAGGAMGLLTAAIAYYAGAAQLLNEENSLITLPVGNLRRNKD